MISKVCTAILAQPGLRLLFWASILVVLGIGMFGDFYVIAKEIAGWFK